MPASIVHAGELDVAEIFNIEPDEEAYPKEINGDFG